MATEEELVYRIDIPGARQLVPMDPNGQSDPYCIVGEAYPDTLEFADPSKALRSKIHFVTLTPVWKGFSIIVRAPDAKVRIEVWDKDQDVDDDFEGLAILDLSTLNTDTPVDTWLPLKGRTEDEKVTGDVHVIVTKGTPRELELTRSRSLSISAQVPVDDEKVSAAQRELKKLHSDLKTKSGRLDKLKETNSVLDLHVVKLKQQVDQLQAEMAKKSSLLEGESLALLKATSQVADLQKALQEYQSVGKLVKEWTTKGQELERLQATLKTGALWRRSKGGDAGNGVGEQPKAKRESSELSIAKIMEQMTEYATMIEELELQLKDKTKELEEGEAAKLQQNEGSKKEIGELQQKIKLREEEIEKYRANQTQQTQQLQERSEAVEAELAKLSELTKSNADLERQLQEKIKTVEELKEQVAKYSKVSNVKVELERQLQERSETVETLKLEIAKQSELSKVKTELEWKLQERSETVETLKLEIAKQAELSKVKSELEEQLSVSTLTIKNLQVELAAKSEEMKEQQTRQQVQQQQFTVDVNIVGNLQATVQDQKVELEKLREANVKIGKQAHDREEQIKSLQIECKSALQQLERERETNKLSSTAVDLNEKDSELLRGHKSTLEAKVGDLQVQLNATTQAYASLQEEMNRVKSQLVDTEKLLEQEKALTPVAVVRTKAKPIQEEEEQVVSAGTGQFAHHTPNHHASTPTFSRRTEEMQATAGITATFHPQKVEEPGAGDGGRNSDLAIQLNTLNLLPASTGDAPLLEKVSPTERRVKKRGCNCYVVT